MRNDNLKGKWDLELECKPDFLKSMERIEAWFEGELVDRAPVRFSAHNSFVNEKHLNRKWKTVKERWYDVEYQVEAFLEGLRGKRLRGETFPVFWPNIGPNAFAAFYGSKLEFAEVTSWAEPCIENWEDLNRLKLDMGNEYFQKVEDLTRHALERCEGKFMVGYTDLHPGVDCAAAWRDTQRLLMDLYDEPDEVRKAIAAASRDFQKVYDHFDTMLKSKNQLSATWMGIPSFGKMHIPSCDFAAMISRQQFTEFCLPVLQDEVKPMTHNIFHLDGKDVARHLEDILAISEIQAIQWVQGVGDDKPILQWLPLIKQIRAAGKSVVVDLEIGELEGFMSAMEPEGILLCIDSGEEEEQKEILKRIEKW